MNATPPAVRIADHRLAGSGAPAWLVAADEPARPRAAVLWLHWLGHRHSDRGEFLPLAVELAARGVVSLLPAGRFPWSVAPDGTEADVQRVRDQLAGHAEALDLLLAQPDVDLGRVAVVGHDYGAMYGALLADRDERVSTLALQALDSRWSDWFATYWRAAADRLAGQGRDAYAAGFADLEPLDAVARVAGRLGDGVQLQWAGEDTFVSQEVRAAYELAAPSARSLAYDGADHMLDDRAARDLTAFLGERLRLTPVDRN